jgi:hypothetical protein
MLLKKAYPTDSTTDGAMDTMLLMGAVLTITCSERSVAERSTASLVSFFAL